MFCALFKHRNEAVRVDLGIGYERFGFHQT